jgi:regulatory protein
VADESDERALALARAVRALARRDHSAASLRAKLARAGVSERARDEAVERLAQAGYVDDGRFAVDRATQLSARGYGDEWIRADLDAQGVPHPAVEEALASLEPERERARRVANRLGSGPRTTRRLQRRGFSEESLEPLLEGPLHSTPAQE